MTALAPSKTKINRVLRFGMDWMLRPVMDWRSLQVDRGALVFIWFGMDADRCFSTPVCHCVFLSRSRYFLQASQTFIVLGTASYEWLLEACTDQGLTEGGHRVAKIFVLNLRRGGTGKTSFPLPGTSCVVS